MEDLEGNGIPKLDWTQRGEEIVREQVPEDVLAKLRDYMIASVPLHAAATIRYRKVALGPDVNDYIVLYHNYVAREFTVVSVEVRNGMTGDPITRVKDRLNE